MINRVIHHSHRKAALCAGSCPGAEVSWHVNDHHVYSDSSEQHVAEAREGNLGEVIDERVKVYGEIVPAFTRQAQAISAVLGHEVQPWEVPLIMIAVKLVRTTEAPDYSDNSDDIEGYLDIFRKLMGEDMVHARSVLEYVELKKQRNG